MATLSKEEAKSIGIRNLQDANLSLCNAWFALEEHTNPGFNKELAEIQTRIRDMIGAIKCLK